MCDTDEEGPDEGGMFDKPRRFTWVDLGVIATGFANNAFGSAQMLFSNLSDQLYAHSRYNKERRDFAESVMSDIKEL